MAVKKQERGTVIKQHEFFTIKHLPSYEGYDKKRKMKDSSIAIFHGKHKLKDGFKTVEIAVNYIVDNRNKYSTKLKAFK